MSWWIKMRDNLFFEFTQLEEQIRILKFVAESSAKGVTNKKELSKLLYLIAENIEDHLDICVEIYEEVQIKLGGK